MWNNFKMTVLLAGLTGLLLAIGQLWGGRQGMTIAIILAAVMNLGSYFFSAKIAIASSGAKPISREENPRIYQIVERLAAKANIPVPKIYMIPTDSPNAFATGRNPNHASVAVTQQANDKQQLIPMLVLAAVMAGSPPEQATADAGYFSEKSVTDAQLEGIDLRVAPHRQKHGEGGPSTAGPPVPGAGVAEQMRHKLRTPEGRAVYKMRKAVVEPVFGQIKERRGFRRFLFRGLGKVEAEWRLICATHNLLKLFHAGWSPQTA